jgi:hypothetical protein
MGSNCKVLAVLIICSFLILSGFRSVSAVSKFNIGDNVKTTDELYVRETPGGNALRDGKPVPVNTFGVIVSGPQIAAYRGTFYTWWKIRYDDDVEGWSAENWLVKEMRPTPKFNIGDNVKTTDELNVRSKPGIDYPVFKTVFKGTLGTIIDFSQPRPRVVSGYNWWKIRYSDGTEGWSSEHRLEKIIQESINSITAAIDKQLLDLIDQYANLYYNSAWNLNLNQYKAWIATIAWAEGGRGGYTAHSQGAQGSDVFNHRANSTFRFSTGIGPFQLDRGGGIENWGVWPTIDKLNPEKAVRSVMKWHYNLAMTGVTLDKFARNSPWYAVNPNKGGNPSSHWKAVTGTDWDSCKNSEGDLNWNYIKEQLAQNAKDLSFRYENNVKNLGLVKWNIKENEGIKTNSEKKVIFDGYYQTWLITARNWNGIELFKYYYTYNSDEKIEVWALDNSQDSANKYRYIFIREYSTGPLPEGSEGASAGETLTIPPITASTPTLIPQPTSTPIQVPTPTPTPTPKPIEIPPLEKIMENFNRIVKQLQEILNKILSKWR